MKTESKQHILERRKEIERELGELIKKIGGGFSLEEVKDRIFNEKDNKDFNNLVAEFSVAENLDELNRDLQLVSDAWNYFPHKALGGISPAEMLLEHRGQAR